MKISDNIINSEETMRKDNSTILVKLLDKIKKVEENLLVKKDNKLYKNLKVYINCKSEISKMGKEKE